MTEQPAGAHDPLPEQTREDTDAGWGESPGSDADDDERYLQERPPHHGD